MRNARRLVRANPCERLSEAGMRDISKHRRGVVEFRHPHGSMHSCLDAP